jgi:hypothetical protein
MTFTIIAKLETETSSTQEKFTLVGADYVQPIIEAFRNSIPEGASLTTKVIAE